MVTLLAATSVNRSVLPGKTMTWPSQYSIKFILFLMVLVAHACSKPSAARTLHTGPIESMSTLTPFAITIQYSDENHDENTKTYVGAFGQYWLYSHKISMVVGCFLMERDITNASKRNGFGKGSIQLSDCEEGTGTSE